MKNRGDKNMTILSKKKIREQILRKRDAINPQEKEILDHKIFKNLINSSFYCKASTIFTFVSFKSEVDTHKLINQAIKDGKIVGVPKIKSKEKGIEVFEIKSLKNLEKGYFGILEPKGNCPIIIPPEDINLALIPGLAFDLKGGRVGYGGGYYDRYLAKVNKKTAKLALGYHFQLLGNVPVDDHDIRINGIITDEGIHTVN